MDIGDIIPILGLIVGFIKWALKKEKDKKDETKDTANELVDTFFRKKENEDFDDIELEELEYEEDFGILEKDFEEMEHSDDEINSIEAVQDVHKEEIRDIIRETEIGRKPKLLNKRNIVNGMILKEILDKPKAFNLKKL